jgi:hypothetical protein
VPDGPYIVTTRRTVATLDEAKRGHDYRLAAPWLSSQPEEWQAAGDALFGLRAPGGTVTTPDGTIIEVTPQEADRA